MCGIATIVSKDNNIETIRTMMELMEHRGRDNRVKIFILDIIGYLLMMFLKMVINQCTIKIFH